MPPTPHKGGVGGLYEDKTELFVVIDNGYAVKCVNAVVAVTMICGTAKQLVKGNKLMMSFTVVVYVVVVYNGVAVGIGRMTVAYIRVCVNTDACLYANVRIAGAGKLTVGVVSPITIDDGNILTGYIVSLNSSNFIYDRFRTNLADQHTAVTVVVPLVSRNDIIGGIDTARNGAILKVIGAACTCAADNTAVGVTKIAPLRADNGVLLWLYRPRRK